MRNEEVTELLAPVVADLGLECLGVEYSPSHGNGLVRVHIEAAGRAVMVDDFEPVSREVLEKMEAKDPGEGRYRLGDSIAGVGRRRYSVQTLHALLGRER